ncbi:MAE_28990/MAE_18760 family HEPN-like nuclease [Bosea sp. NPDC003192]|uniref:MAE_28990/MAE_18760 family HEPN-like nuclease n=1 Tax=Bosea sp. NPDC003192 TaxID=3390551 RepID=UPI003D06F5FB
MSNGLQSDFQTRTRQVRHYLSILVAIERITPLGRATRTQEGRLLTARAGVFLVLYNLVEATTRNTIEAIHDRIATETVPFEELSASLRREAMKRFRTRLDPEAHYGATDLARAFVGIALEGGISLSGNVDARHIRELAEVYGFSHSAPSHTWGGSDLVTVKNNRNNLAHGRVTFEDVGRDYGIEQIRGLSLRTLGYMRAILGNVTQFLDERRYLHTEPRPASQGPARLLDV